MILRILPRQQLLLLVRMLLCEILALLLMGLLRLLRLLLRRRQLPLFTSRVRLFWRWLLVWMVLLLGIHASQWRSKMLR